MHTGRRRSLLTIAASALVALVISGGVAVAGGGFTDVPPSYPFADEIDAIAQAGITTGFNDGTYRPGDPVSRGAMAAFMGRGFGRAAYGVDSDSNPADNTNTSGAQVQITAGATGTGTTGYVVVQGTAQMSTAEADCQCTLAMEIVDVTDNVFGSTRTSMSNDVNAIGINVHSTSAQARFVIEDEETHTYRVRFRATTAGGNTAITVSSDITAVYVPFDGFGNQGAPV
jgi:hypothetical protein